MYMYDKTQKQSKTSLKGNNSYNGSIDGFSHVELFVHVQKLNKINKIVFPG